MKYKKINREYLFINKLPYDFKNNRFILILNQAINNFNNWQLNLKPLENNVVERLIAELIYVRTIIYQSKPKDADSINKIIDDMFKFIDKFLPLNKKIDFNNLPCMKRPDRRYHFINKISTNVYLNDDITFYINELIDKFNRWQLNLKPINDEFEKLIAYLKYVSVKLVDSKIEDKKEMRLIISNIMIFINKYLPLDESINYPENW